MHAPINGAICNCIERQIFFILVNLNDEVVIHRVQIRSTVEVIRISARNKTEPFLMPEELMKFVRSIANCLTATLIAGAAYAKYPERPINMVIPYGAGGATGSDNVQFAMADGYTMLFARVGSHSANPAVKATEPYAFGDFCFVTVYEINPVACAVRTSSGITSMQDLVSRVGTDYVTYSSSGVGSFLHLAAVMVLKEFGVENPREQATHIPQKGGGTAATAVLNGTATFPCTDTSELASFGANDQLKPLMVTTAEPVIEFDAPTAADLGNTSLHQLVGWTGIAGPDNLPDDVVEKWGARMAEATRDQGFLDMMTLRGWVIRLMDPYEANKFIQDQFTTFRKLVDELGMRIEG